MKINSTGIAGVALMASLGGASLANAKVVDRPNEAAASNPLTQFSLPPVKKGERPPSPCDSLRLLEAQFDSFYSKETGGTQPNWRFAAETDSFPFPVQPATSPAYKSGIHLGEILKVARIGPDGKQYYITLDQAAEGLYGPAKFMKELAARCDSLSTTKSE